MRTEEILCNSSTAKSSRVTRGRLRLAFPTLPRLLAASYSFADQALAVGGTFLANVVLARTQTKEAFGTFVLCYSVFTFLYGLYNAAILEPYTVYGSGRYRVHYAEYLQLVLRSNLLIALALSGIIFLSCLLFVKVAPTLASPALTGLACTIGVLLSATFLRRAFYVQREPYLAARASLLFFITVCCGLLIAARVRLLNGFSVFLILALGWVVAGALFGKKLAVGKPTSGFLQLEPKYWREHWVYSRWALASVFVFQLATQGYYWLLAALLSVKQVGELRAVYVLVSPIEQVFIAISFLVLPAMSSHYSARRMRDFLTLWKQNALAVASVTIPFALIIRVLGKTVVHILYAGKFDGLTPSLYMLALSPVLIGTAGTIVNALNAAEKPGLVFCGYLSSGIATFLFGIPLVRHFGLKGAVYGILVSGALLVITLAVAFFLSTWKHTTEEKDAVSYPA